MALLERVGGGSQKPVLVAVELLCSGHDNAGGTVNRRPLDQEGESLMERWMTRDKP